MTETIIATLRNEVGNKVDLVRITFEDVNPKNRNVEFSLDEMRQIQGQRTAIVRRIVLRKLEFLDLLRAGLTELGVNWETAMPKLSRENIVK